MTSLNFYLRDKGSKTETPITLFVSEGGKRWKISTGEKIHPRYWNLKKQKAKASYSESLSFNQFLDSFMKEVQEIILQLKSEYKPISGRSITNMLIANRAGDDEQKSWNLLTHFDAFIEESKTSRTKNTLKTYHTLRSHLYAYEQYHKVELTFEMINKDFQQKFQHFLIKHKQLSDTSIHKDFAILKRFMSHAADKELHDNTVYHTFKIKAAPTVQIALTQKEIELLEVLALSSRPALMKIRDMFLFGCYTSLRYSDLASLKPENIKTEYVDGDEVTYLHLISQKTRGEVVAPLDPKALALLHQYQDDGRPTCFPDISNQKFNIHIKEVAQLAGIEEEELVIRYIGTKRIEEKVPRYKLISSHTQRRTFISLFFERGGSVEACMAFTGHKNYKELETYRSKTVVHKLKTVQNALRKRE